MVDPNTRTWGLAPRNVLPSPINYSSPSPTSPHGGAQCAVGLTPCGGDIAVELTLPWGTQGSVTCPTKRMVPVGERGVREPPRPKPRGD